MKIKLIELNNLNNKRSPKLDFNSYKVNDGIPHLDQITKDLFNNTKLITPELKTNLERNINKFIDDNKNNEDLLSNIVNYLQEGTISKLLNESEITIKNKSYKLINLLDIVKYHRSNLFTHDITSTSKRIINNIFLKNLKIEFNNKLKYLVKNKDKINNSIKQTICEQLESIITSNKKNNNLKLTRDIYEVLSPHSNTPISVIKDEDLRNMLTIILYSKNTYLIKKENNFLLHIQKFILENND
jgi:hypothetical protein